jgi:hypothetical protein
VTPAHLQVVTQSVAQHLPSHALPEVLKVVCATINGHYSWPNAYRFVAPKGCGTTLSNLIHSPSNLRAALIKELTRNSSTLAAQTGSLELDDVVAFVREADFSIFGTVELHELIDQHAGTRWHAIRFGVALPSRPPVPSPSDEPAEHEQRYLEQLLDAYNERYPGQGIGHATARKHETLAGHYTRQREAFYSAEALRVFARDSVPEGTFDGLQSELHDGVIDTHDRDYDDGLDRLYEVTRVAGQLAMTSNELLPRVTVRDRSGICHQLANEDRLIWCHAATE